MVPAGLKYLLKAYWANSHDARPLRKVSGGWRPPQLPPCFPLHHLLKWKKCLRGKLPQFSVTLIPPLGKPKPVSPGGMQTVLQPGVCTPILAICQPFAQIPNCPEQKSGRTCEVWVKGNGRGGADRDDKRVIASVRGGHVEVGGIIRDVTSFQHRSHKGETARHPWALLELRALLRGYRCNIPPSYVCAQDSATEHSLEPLCIYWEASLGTYTNLSHLASVSRWGKRSHVCHTPRWVPEASRTVFQLSLKDHCSLSNCPHLLPPAHVRVIFWHNFHKGRILCCLKNSF